MKTWFISLKRTPINLVAFVVLSFWPCNSVLEMKTEDGETLSPPSPGYTDITVREAVEWTMNNDSGFTYIDVRSAEEHENLATPR